MIEINALCAVCGPDLFFEQLPVSFYAEDRWVPVESIQEAVDLALAGVELRSASGHPLRPRAFFLVNGSALCGLCIRSIGPDALRAGILAGARSPFSRR